MQPPTGPGSRTHRACPPFGSSSRPRGAPRSKLERMQCRDFDIKNGCADDDSRRRRTDGVHSTPASHVGAADRLRQRRTRDRLDSPSHVRKLGQLRRKLCVRQPGGTLNWTDIALHRDRRKAEPDYSGCADRARDRDRHDPELWRASVATTPRAIYVQLSAHAPRRLGSPADDQKTATTTTTSHACVYVVEGTLVEDRFHIGADGYHGTRRRSGRRRGVRPSTRVHHGVRHRAGRLPLDPCYSPPLCDGYYDADENAPSVAPR